MKTAYLAGVVDSDGCISVNLQIVDKKMRYVRPKILIAKKQEKIARALAEATGGNLYHVNNRIGKIYQLEITGHWRVKILLEQILPYLIEKHKQAELLLELIRSREAKHHQGKYTSIEKQLILQITSLNAGSHLTERALEWLNLD